jgi:hypothetical protein
LLCCLEVIWEFVIETVCVVVVLMRDILTGSQNKRLKGWGWSTYTSQPSIFYP